MNINVSAIFVGVLSAIIFLSIVKKQTPVVIQKTCVAVIKDKYGYQHEINGTVKGEI